MEKTYEELVRDITTTNDLFSLNEKDVYEILYEARPIWFYGHFELLSNRHTDTFFRFALIAQRPWLMGKISKEMISWISYLNLEVDVILGTSRAGLLFAYDIARELSKKRRTRAVYAKSDQETGYPLPQLLEGFNIKAGERVLIVNDIITTGRGVEILIDLAKAYGSEVAGICLFASRASETDTARVKQIKDEFKENFHTIVNFKMNNWEKEKCDLCAKGVPYVRSAEINSFSSSQPIKKILEPLPKLRVA